jgi:ketosteroid isomerase-like protein
MTRDEVLAIVDAAYDARVRGDLDALKVLAAPDATFEFPGEATLLRNFPVAGRMPGPRATESLIALIAMTEVRRLDAVVEGNRAVVISHACVSFAGRAPFETVLCDMIELDESGRICSLIQFADTARYAAEMEALATR